MPLTPGQHLGPYEIIGSLGAGGMGEVYRARDVRLDRLVAIKLLPTGLERDPETLTRFEREARAVAALSHPNILAIHDFARSGDTTYAVMELLEGETLSERIAGRALPPRKAIEIATQITRGLAAAHDRRIVHRDLKPGNVFVTTEGSVKILDFGLAQSKAAVASAHADSVTLEPSTAPGVMLGTVAYMSPEQVRGEPTDHRTDIFSLGCVLYEMLTGRRPFQRDTAPETMTAILREDPPDLPVPVSPALVRTLRRCLEKRPEERFQSARDLAFALETALEDSSVRTERLPSTWMVTGRYRAVAAGAIAGLVLGALGAGIAVSRSRGAPAGGGFPEFRRLTFERGTVHEARFAPDGRTIVYGAAWDGRPVRTFLTRTDVSESVPLTIPDGQVLAVSRNGELAVSLEHTFEGWMGAGTLATSSLLSSAPRALLEGVREADWSPGSADLAIVRRTGGLERLEFPAGRVLYQTSGYISHVRFSPAGDRIAFADHPVYADDAGDVAIVDLEGQKTVLARGWQSLTGLAWTPGGNEICFTASRGTAAANAVHAVTLSGDQRVMLSAPTWLRLFDIAPDGRVLLAYGYGDRRVDALLTGDTAPREVSLNDGSASTWIADDGSAVVITDQHAIRYAAYLLRAGERGPVRLGEGQGYGVSPDGRWLAAIPATQPRILLHPTGTGRSRELPNPDAAVFDVVSWLPDGRIVAFGQPVGGLSRGYVQSIDGGPPRPFTAEGVGPVRWWAVVSSPDAARVVAQMPDGTVVAHPIEARGSPEAIRGWRTGDIPVGWSSQPGVLFVARGRGVPWIVERLDLTTGRRSHAMEIRAREEAGLRISTLAVARDGRHYVHSYSRLLTALYVLTGLE